MHYCSSKFILLSIIAREKVPLKYCTQIVYSVFTDDLFSDEAIGPNLISLEKIRAFVENVGVER